VQVKTNSIFILLNVFCVRHKSLLHIQVMFRSPTFHEKAYRNHIQLFFVGLVEPRLGVKLNTLELAQGDKHICSFLGAVYTLLYEGVSDSVSKCLELLWCSILRSLLNLVLVMVSIPIKSVDCECILKVNRECLVLVWEVNEHLLVALFN